MSEQITNPKMLLRQYQRQSDVEGLYSLLDLEIHPQIKKEVLDTLAGIGTPEAYEGMGALLIQGRSNLSEYALQRLNKIPGAEVVGIMARGLESQDVSLALWTLRLLFNREESEAVTALLNAAKEGPNAPVRQLAARLLKEIAEDRNRVELIDSGTWEQITDFLNPKSEAPPESAPNPTPIGSSFTRGESLLEKLRRYRLDNNVDGLGEFLSASISIHVRKTALDCLVSIGTPEAIDRIGDTLTAGDRELAEQGMGVLADLRHSDAVKAMAKGLAFPDSSFKSYVLYTLSRRTEPEAVKAILEAYKDPDPQVNQSVVTLLKAVADDANRMVGLDEETRQEILSVLRPPDKEEAETEPSEESAGDSVQAQLKRFRDNDDVSGLMGFFGGTASLSVRSIALECLAQIGSDAAVSAVGQIIEQESQEVAEHGINLAIRIPDERAVEAVSRGLKSSDISIRAYALFSLSRRNDTAAMEHVIRAVQDEVPQIGKYALRLVKEIAAKPDRLEKLEETIRDGILDIAKGEKKVEEKKQHDGREHLFLHIKRASEEKDVETLGAFLKNTISPQARELALEGLKAVGGKEAFEQIEIAMESGNRELCEQIMNFLSAVPGAESVRAMAKSMQSSDPTFRSYALYCLYRRPEPESIKWIWRTTKDGDEKIAATASEMLREMVKDIDRLGQLEYRTLDGIFQDLDEKLVLNMLDERYPEVIKLAAIRRVGKMEGDHIAKTLISISEKGEGEFREAALNALEDMMSFTADLALPLLEVDSADVRRRGLAVYGRQCKGKEGKGEAVVPLIDDPDPGVRVEALRVAETVAGDLGAEKAIKRVDDPIKEVRLQAVTYLSVVNHPDVVPTLKKATKDPDPAVEKKAIYALAIQKVWDPDIIDQQLRLLSEGVNNINISVEDSDGCCAIMGMLQERKPEGAFEVLIEAAHSISVRIRRVATDALETYPEDMRVEALASMIDTDDKNILKKVAMVLGELGDPRAIVPLVRATEEIGGPVGKKALNLLEKQADINDLDFLIRGLRMRYPSVKKFAATKIQSLDSPDFIEPLLDAMQTDDLEAQIAITQAFKNFAYDERVAKILVDNITDGQISLALINIETIGEAAAKGYPVKAAIEPLTRALGSRFMKKKASEALRRLGDRKGLLAIKRRELREAMLPKRLKPWEIEKKKMEERKRSIEVAGQVNY